MLVVGGLIFGGGLYLGAYIRDFTVCYRLNVSKLIFV